MYSLLKMDTIRPFVYPAKMPWFQMPWVIAGKIFFSSVFIRMLACFRMVSTEINSVLLKCR